MVLHFLKIFYIHYLRQKEDRKINALHTRVTQAYLHRNILIKLESSGKAPRFPNCRVEKFKSRILFKSNISFPHSQETLSI